QLLTQGWAQPGDAVHRLYKTECDAKDVNGRDIITAYAVIRPDGQRSLLLINKDPTRELKVRLRVQGPGREKTPVAGKADVFQFSSEQYLWRAGGAHGYPVRSNPPKHTSLVLEAESIIRLPPYSLNVVRWAGGR